MKEQIEKGAHSAEDYHGKWKAAGQNPWDYQTRRVDKWFLQARWYMENIKTICK